MAPEGTHNHMMQQNLSLMSFFVKQHLHAGHSELGVVIRVMTKTPVLRNKYFREEHSFKN